MSRQLRLPPQQLADPAPRSLAGGTPTAESQTAPGVYRQSILGRESRRSSLELALVAATTSAHQAATCETLAMRLRD